jgi:hypothetical protein
MIASESFGRVPGESEFKLAAEVRVALLADAVEHEVVFEDPKCLGDDVLGVERLVRFSFEAIDAGFHSDAGYLAQACAPAAGVAAGGP